MALYEERSEHGEYSEQVPQKWYSRFARERINLSASVEADAPYPRAGPAGDGNGRPGAECPTKDGNRVAARGRRPVPSRPWSPSSSASPETA